MRRTATGFFLVKDLLKALRDQPLAAESETGIIYYVNDSTQKEHYIALEFGEEFFPIKVK